MTGRPPRIGVVVVAYQSVGIIDECLDSLFASRGAELSVVVVDNSSTDATGASVLEWASGKAPSRRRPESPLTPAPLVPRPVAITEARSGEVSLPAAPLTLLRSSINGGYGYGVNQQRALASAG